MNQTVTDKKGNTIYICNFSYTDSEGKVETCRAPKACEICGQCSRIDGDHECGHCPGHLGLNEHIHGIPGREQTKARNDVSKKQADIRQQAKLRKERQARRAKVKAKK